MTAGSVVFLFVLVAAAGFFALNVQRLVGYLRSASPRTAPTIRSTRIRNVLAIGIAQKKIFRDPVAGPMHALIFWGFMVLTAGTVEILIAGVFPAFSYAAVPARPALPRLLGVAGRLRGARHRRGRRSRCTGGIVLHPQRLEGDDLEHTDALIILSMIGGLMVTLLLSNGVPARRRSRRRSARRRSCRVPLGGGVRRT